MQYKRLRIALVLVCLLLPARPLPRPLAVLSTTNVGRGNTRLDWCVVAPVDTGPVRHPSAR